MQLRNNNRGSGKSPRFEPDPPMDLLLEELAGLVDALEPVPIVPAGDPEDASDPPTNPTRANLEFIRTIRRVSGDASGGMSDFETEPPPRRAPILSLVPPLPVGGFIEDDADEHPTEQFPSPSDLYMMSDGPGVLVDADTAESDPAQASTHRAERWVAPTPMVAQPSLVGPAEARESATTERTPPRDVAPPHSSWSPPEAAPPAAMSRSAAVPWVALLAGAAAVVLAVGAVAVAVTAWAG